MTSRRRISDGAANSLAGWLSVNLHADTLRLAVHKSKRRSARSPSCGIKGNTHFYLKTRPRWDTSTSRRHPRFNPLSSARLSPTALHPHIRLRSRTPRLNSVSWPIGKRLPRSHGSGRYLSGSPAGQLPDRGGRSQMPRSESLNHPSLAAWRSRLPGAARGHVRQEPGWPRRVVLFRRVPWKRVLVHRVCLMPVALLRASLVLNSLQREPPRHHHQTSAAPFSASAPPDHTDRGPGPQVENEQCDFARPAPIVRSPRGHQYHELIGKVGELTRLQHRLALGQAVILDRHLPERAKGPESGNGINNIKAGLDPVEIGNR